MPYRGLQHRVQIRSDLKETYQVRKHTEGSHLDPQSFLGVILSQMTFWEKITSVCGLLGFFFN